MIRQLVGDAFSFRQLDKKFSADELKDYSNSLQRQFSKLTKDWNDKLHSEWTARMFLSAKMIYSATLLLNTLDYSRQKNVRVTEPYLLYYSNLNCCRALIFTHPAQIWQDGKLMMDSHTKIIHKTSDIISRLNLEVGIETKILLQTTKDYRELFSYKYPANGLRTDEIFKEINIDTITERCNLLCEIAQFTSGCFQSSFDKNCVSKTFYLNEDVLEACFSYHGDTYSLTDDEDVYRISYIMRKVKRPYNIYYTMTEGMTDDFFGSWVADDNDDDDAFNPDDRTINIFDLP